MREKGSDRGTSDRGGLDGAVGRSMDSDGHNVAGVESRLGRKYDGKTTRVKGSSKRGAKRAKSSARKAR